MVVAAYDTSSTSSSRNSSSIISNEEANRLRRLARREGVRYHNSTGVIHEDVASSGECPVQSSVVSFNTCESRQSFQVDGFWGGFDRSEHLEQIIRGVACCSEAVETPQAQAEKIVSAVASLRLSWNQTGVLLGKALRDSWSIKLVEVYFELRKSLPREDLPDVHRGVWDALVDWIYTAVYSDVSLFECRCGSPHPSKSFVWCSHAPAKALADLVSSPCSFKASLCLELLEKEYSSCKHFVDRLVYSLIHKEKWTLVERLHKNIGQELPREIEIELSTSAQSMVQEIVYLREPNYVNLWRLKDLWDQCEARDFDGIALQITRLTCYDGFAKPLSVLCSESWAFPIYKKVIEIVQRTFVAEMHLKRGCFEVMNTVRFLSYLLRIPNYSPLWFRELIWNMRTSRGITRIVLNMFRRFIQDLGRSPITGSMIHYMETLWDELNVVRGNQ